MRTATFLLCVSASALAADPATTWAQPSNGYVGVYSDASGTVDCMSIPPFSGATLYVVAHLSGGSTAGISGAEFRVEVTDPDGWLFNYIPAQGSIPVGTLIDTSPATDADGSGLNIAFGTCQAQGDAVFLGTISVFNLAG